MLFLIGYSLFFLGVYSVILLFFFKSEKQPVCCAEHSVAVLLAVRNEEDNLEECLKRLLSQTYSHYKILVGDDASQDRTREILAEYQKKFPAKIIVYTLKNNKEAKQGVLKFLLRKTQDEIVLITDADVRVSEAWIETMVGLQKKEQADLLNHPTLVEGNSWLALWENLDWLQAISVFFFLQKINIPTTGMGNNMLFLKKAYEETGGYEVLPFSLTEDFALYHLFLQKKKKAVWSWNKKAIARTLGSSSWQELVAQRRRWLVGAMQLPWKVRLFTLFLLTGYYVLWIAVGTDIRLILLPAIYYLLTAKLLFKFSPKENFGKKLISVFLHPVYNLLLQSSLWMAWLQRKSVVWKGRKY